MTQTIDFKEDDIVFLIDINSNKILKDKQFIIRKIEFENTGSFHDGFEETYYADLEDIQTRIVERKLIIYKHFGYGFNYVYIKKIK
jgi:hypothetical protein